MTPQEQGKLTIDLSVDIMADCETGRDMEDDQVMAASSATSTGPSVAHSAVVQEPPAKVAKQHTLAMSSESAGNTNCSPTSPPETRVRYKANYMRGMVVQERFRHQLWEERMAKEWGFEPVPWPVMPGERKGMANKGEKSQGEKTQGEKTQGEKSKGEKSKGEKSKGSKDKVKGKENDSLQINASSPTSNLGAYRPYSVGDVVLDLKFNAKCKVVLEPGKSNALPTLSLPMASSVENCCHFDLLAFTTPAFPRNKPPLTSVKSVIVFDVFTPNPMDHSQQWRFMDQYLHKQAVPWVTSYKRMSQQDRTTVLALKDYGGKMLCKFTTFCRVEEGWCCIINLILTGNHMQFVSFNIRSYY